MGTESAACYKMELERPGGRTREEVDVEWRGKSHFLKGFGYSLKCSSMSRVTVDKGWSGFVVQSYFFRMGCRHGKPELRDDDVTYLAKSRYNVFNNKVSVKSRFSSMYLIFSKGDYQNCPP